MRITASLILLAAAAAWAQPAPGRGGPPQPAVKSPEVSADRTVTFRLRAPNAKEVAVNGLPGGRLALQKDEQGVWSVTSSPLEPEVYTYSFNVDGATFSDPGNPLLKPNFKAGGQSMVRVPGPVSWEPAGGPRGVVAHHFYKSAIVGDDRDFYVYTPPNYDPNRKEPYPVLYLLHGLGDDAAGWLTTGSANIILDNLIAQGKAKPMIMVNTLGYGAPEMVAGGGRGGMNGPGIMEKNSEYFARALVEEVLPQVEKQYRVSKDRKDRAVAGLSMGGAEALFTGLRNIDRFAWVASFSGAFVMWNSDRNIQMGPAVFDKTFPTLDAKAASQLRLLWISCGVSDGLVGVNRQFNEWLAAKKIQPKYQEHPGAHTWPVWRHNLTDLAPLLFQKN
jgi:enterochelin esterase family protein